MNFEINKKYVARNIIVNKTVAKDNGKKKQKVKSKKQETKSNIVE